MAKSPSNHGRPVTPETIGKIKQLARQNTPTGRTESSVRSIASNNDISLKPTNQSPYNRRS